MAKKRKHAGITAYIPLNLPPVPLDTAPLKSSAWLPLPGSHPVPLDRRTGCAWPLGDGHPFLFCNEPTEGERSWCPAHFALGNRPVVERAPVRRNKKPAKHFV